MYTQNRLAARYETAKGNKRLGARATLIAYLKVKVDECDWHGVSDAANDLRVLEAKNENAR